MDSPIKEQVLQFICSNFQQPKDRRIGVEIETIFFDNQMRRLPVNPGDQMSSTELVDKLVKHQGRGVGSYSLEPGGQVEWASAPFVSLHDIQAQLDSHNKALRSLCDSYKVFPLGFSLDPIYSPEKVKLINMKKYQLMNKRFYSTGKHGPWMMRNTASVQVNIDMTNEKDGEIMAYVADCLQPFSFLLFSNSPFLKGSPAESRNLRLEIWNDTDSPRCGNLFDHGIIKHQNLIYSFVEHILSVPAIFILDNFLKTRAFGGTLGEWLKSLYNDRTLSDKHIQSALRQIFTHIRFKSVLEVRGSDRPPFGYELAPAAFWCGLLTAENVREELRERVSCWSNIERKSLNAAALRLDLSQKGPEGKTCGQWLKIIADCALRGLEERKRFLKIKSETVFLESFLESALDRAWTLKNQDLFSLENRDLGFFIRENYLKNF